MTENIGGDDLDDGLEYNFDSHSDNDAEPSEFLEPLSDGEPEVIQPATNGKRREKRKERDDEVNEEDDIHPERKQVKSKKSKKGNNEKLKERKKQKVSTIVDQKTSLASMSPSLIADYVAGKVKRKNPDLSTVELNEMYLPESQFKETSDFNQTRDVENFAAFLTKYFGSVLKPDVKEKLVVVLTISALRACDVTRGLKSVQGGAIKLIKKNSVKYDETALKMKKYVMPWIISEWFCY